MCYRNKLFPQFSSILNCIWMLSLYASINNLHASLHVKRKKHLNYFYYSCGFWVNTKAFTKHLIETFDNSNCTYYVVLFAWCDFVVSSYTHRAKWRWYKLKQRHIRLLDDRRTFSKLHSDGIFCFKLPLCWQEFKNFKFIFIKNKLYH
jgi:hypothetical protein